ncbi:MAG: hypothetical protein IJT77_12355 [Clostridia bacterium]|nr:hypothetical protein [Clostridia bacterium]
MVVFDVIEKIENLSKEELVDAIRMLVAKAQPSIVPLLEMYVEVLESEKEAGTDDSGIKEEITAIEANAIILSYEEYVDDQPEIGNIYDALDNLLKLLPEHPATEDQVRRFGNLKSQYHEVFCDCGCEDKVDQVLKLMA